MTSLKNKLCIDFASNPDWASMFTTSKSGDKVKMTVTFTIDEVDTSGVEGSLDKVELPELAAKAGTPMVDEDGEPVEGSGKTPDTEINAKAPVFIAMSREDTKY